MTRRTIQMRLCAREGCNERFDPWDREEQIPPRFCSKECARGKRATIQTRPRKPISVASNEQRAKRRAGVSIVSGESEGLDMAHLCSRALGGCNDPDCAVPLTRAEHIAFDAGELDLLRYLVPHHVDEIVHAVRHYRGDLPALIERLTGCKCVLVDRRPDVAA